MAFLLTTAEDIITYLNIQPTQVSLLKDSMIEIEEFDTANTTTYVDRIESKIVYLKALDVAEKNYIASIVPGLPSSATTTVTEEESDDEVVIDSVDPTITSLTELASVKSLGYSGVEFSGLKVSFDTSSSAAISQNDSVFNAIGAEKSDCINYIRKVLADFGYCNNYPQARLYRG